MKAVGTPLYTVSLPLKEVGLPLKEHLEVLLHSGAMNALKALIPFILGHRRPLIVGILCLTVTNTLNLASPWVLKLAVDGLESGITRRELAQFAGILVGIAILSGIFRYFMRRIIIGTSREVEYELRQKFYGHLTSMDLAYYTKTPTGDLMALATNDLNAVRMVLGPGLMYSLNTIMMLSLGLALMLSLSWKLTLASLIPMLFISLFMYRYGQIIHRLFTAVQEQFADITARAQEYLSGVRVVRAYTQESAAYDDLARRNQDYMNRNMKMVRVNGLMHPMVRMLAGISVLVALSYGGTLVIQNQFSLGSLVAFLAYLNMLIWPMIALGWVVTIFQRGAASMKRFQAVLNTQPDIDDPPHVAGSLRPGGDIELKNVSFSYPNRPDTAALSDVSLTIVKGETIGIAGRTGSGKTTLVNLIPRLIDPTSGTVSLGSVDLRDLPLGELRGLIGFVPQEAFLFSMTVGQNIAFGRPESSQEDIDGMARLAQLYNEVDSFPRGFGTMVGERGVTLSGGQKQRTAISRALLRNPDILILDDALASVDTGTEEEILGGLRTYMKNRTTILVAHRVSTLQLADRILMLDEGRLIEQGTHDELMKNGGPYAELARLQKLEEELEAV